MSAMEPRAADLSRWDELEGRVELLVWEGGVAYLASLDGEPVLAVSQAAYDWKCSILIFSSPSERESYLRARGWPTEPKRTRAWHIEEVLDPIEKLQEIERRLRQAPAEDENAARLLRRVHEWISERQRRYP